ncbi:hypothetical protein [Catellatospora tritici]|uniref:hypothetical protein n=1 Tax=Catellatospora tritici TaxID=2851566 RepID=UPI001C2DB9F0|nr:hypothetical protein [Catellatospora tritici]MBV1851352.1 hypothetical protein [Catellatospora tritici]
MTAQRLLLRFSYFEHDWTGAVDWPEGAEAELLRRGTEGRWQEAVDADEPEEFDSADALAQRVEEVLAGEWEMPAAAARAPMDRLRAFIAEGGWTFVAGDFAEYEGHHNDTEMLVRLVR